MKKITLALFLTSFALVSWANPGRYQISQACVEVGCFSGDDPLTKTVEITQSSGTFVLTSNLVFDGSDNGMPAILIDTNALHGSAVTLDLNGFKIFHTGIADAATNGVVVEGQNSEVRIMNGQISAFNDGIQGRSGAGLIIENMVFRINRDDAVSLTRGVIRNNKFHANNYGVFAVNGTGVIATDEFNKKIMLVENMFSDSEAGQKATAGFSSGGYCRDNVNTIPDNNNFGACTLVGDNICDGAPCSNNRSTAKQLGKE